MPRTATGHNPEVEAYIARSAPFAQPILRHLRGVMHEGAPAVIEGMKWSHAFFMLPGPKGEVILGNMAAFKAHCSFGLWGTEITRKLRAEGVASGGSMGSFGKIASLDDLPPRTKLVSYVREAASKIATGERTKAWSRPRVAKPEAEVPAELEPPSRRTRPPQRSLLHSLPAAAASTATGSPTPSVRRPASSAPLPPCRGLPRGRI